jgi:hypothetical protein
VKYLPPVGEPDALLETAFSAFIRTGQIHVTLTFGVNAAATNLAGFFGHLGGGAMSHN